MPHRTDDEHLPDAPEGSPEPCEFDEGYEGVDESTPPPGFCQEAWDYRRTLYEDPMSEGAPVGELVDAWERKHYHKCEICANRLDLERMP